MAPLRNGGNLDSEPKKVNNRQTISFLTRRFRDAGIHPDTRHGQNFLVDLNLVRLLADAAHLEAKDVVLEIGTGTGSLTALLAARAGAVLTVEISQELHQLASEELVDHDNVTLLRMDALKNKNRFNQSLLDTIARQVSSIPQGRLKLVANLPFNIAPPVISNLLLADIVPYSMTATIQKELGDRITARPGTKDYGALSVWIQSQCDAKVLRVLPPSVFWPRPKVHSAMIQLVLDPARRGRIPDLRFFNTFLRTVFTHRRKFLRSGLTSAYKKQLGKPAIDQVLKDLGFGPQVRAEQLSVSELMALSEEIRTAAPDGPQLKPPSGGG
jgi:16S rRNA (adenine1518-N6/adenine1519-N6)-dimethyltransferase